MALLAAAMSVGAVAGGVFSGWLPRIRRQGLAVVVAIVVWGLAMVGFGVAGGLADGTAGPCCGLRWCSWRLAVPPTWCRAAFRIDDPAAGGVRRDARPAAGCVHRRRRGRAAAGRRGARRRGRGVVGTTVAAAGGGALVVVGVVIAALAVPAFIRYRVTESRQTSETSAKCPDV